MSDTHAHPVITTAILRGGYEVGSWISYVLDVGMSRRGRVVLTPSVVRVFDWLASRLVRPARVGEPVAETGCLTSCSTKAILVEMGCRWIRQTVRMSDFGVLAFAETGWCLSALIDMNSDIRSRHFDDHDADCMIQYKSCVDDQIRLQSGVSQTFLHIRESSAVSFPVCHRLARISLSTRSSISGFCFLQRLLQLLLSTQFLLCTFNDSPQALSATVKFSFLGFVQFDWHRADYSSPADYRRHGQAAV